ncbi:MAG: ferredoxin--NADP reductase [Ferruginibacter sp.]|nr:ferredoxin--NADP reductase [Cytophagales bacterium]
MAYYQLKVKEIVRETSDTITIHFAQPVPHPIAYHPGQFLTLLLDIDGERVRRSYSMCSSPHADQTLAVSVKRVTGGKVSNFLNDRLRTGDTVEVMEPTGTFTPQLNPAHQRHIVLLGGGSGITPLMSIIKSVLATETRSQVSLIYGSRNRRSIIFKGQLDALQAKYGGRFHVIHVLSQSEDDWEGHRGRLNQTLILKLLEQLPESDQPTTEYYVCGPEGLMEEVKRALSIRRVSPERIHKESFTAPVPVEKPAVLVAEAVSNAVVTREVTVLYEGSEYKFTVTPRQTILEAALDLDIDLPYSCQSGMCTACMGKCVSGRVKLDEEDGLSERERKEGYVLTCVGHPLTDNVVIEID